MRSLETEAATWARGARVRVEMGGAVTYRPALFVFALEGGRAAWVEPAYLDPMGAPTPAMHVADAWDDAGQPAGPAAFTLRTAAWVATVFGLAEDDDDEALAWGLQQLKAAGTTWARERARLLSEVIPTA